MYKAQIINLRVSPREKKAIDELTALYNCTMTELFKSALYKMIKTEFSDDPQQLLHLTDLLYAPVSLSK